MQTLQLQKSIVYLDKQYFQYNQNPSEKTIIKTEIFQKSINFELSPLAYNFVNNNVTSQILGAFSSPLNRKMKENIFKVEEEKGGED